MKSNEIIKISLYTFKVWQIQWKLSVLTHNKKPKNERYYKFSWILTLTEVISVRILRMRIISPIMNFYLSHAIALQKQSNERSYKFSWILTLTEVIGSYKKLKVFRSPNKWRPLITL